ncbi:MAG: T9SS type A sorting domain-containing protein [Ignavibacteriaceae bacterium]
MKKFFLFIVSVMLFCATTLIAQELTLKTYGVSPRDVERDTLEHYFDQRYNSLQNVGVETKVFLQGQFVDSTLSTPTWTFLEKPAGSTAAFGTTKDLSDSTQLTTFIPDVIGGYIVEFADGSAADTIRISAGLFLGVTNGDPNCKVCHNTAQWDFKYDKWMETGHAHALEKGLDGEKGSFFNNDCVQCHSTGYDLLASNDGFDDFPFVFPDTLMPGMYDSLLTVYPDAMARANIQCEQCHGPGSEHFGNKFNIAKVMNVENCNYCHNAGTHHVYGEQWLYSGHDATEFDGRGFHGGHGVGAFIARGNSASCAPCHSGAGHVQWENEGRPVNEFGLPASITDVPETTKHTCATCHDPHDATNEHQLRFADTQLGDGTPITMDLYGAGANCMQCHRARRNAPTYSADPGNASSHYGPHHGPQADLLLAGNIPVFEDENGNLIEFRTSPHAVAVLTGHDKGDACVNCHMAGEHLDPNGDVNLVGGHSWNMNDPEGTDFVEACAPCHGPIGTSFKDKKYYFNGVADHDGDGIAEGVQLEVHGLMEQLALLLPPVGVDEVLVEEGDSTLTPSIMKSAYVYVWIDEDRSFGIHNPAFTVQLLQVAIEEVGGVVSAVYPESGMPQDYQLAQNYPNPFNPSTTIEYSLPEQADVTIKVYDVLGNELEVLFSGNESAGTHSLNWNASNYASGIYFYSMNTGTFNQVKKMLLIK